MDNDPDSLILIKKHRSYLLNKLTNTNIEIVSWSKRKRRGRCWSKLDARHYYQSRLWELGVTEKIITELEQRELDKSK